MKLHTLWKRGLAGMMTAAFVITGMPVLTAAAEVKAAADFETEKLIENDAADPNNYTQVVFDQEYKGSADWDQTTEASYIINIDQPGRLILSTHSKGGLYYTIMDNDSLYSNGNCKVYWRPGNSSLTISGDNVHTIDLLPNPNGKYYMYITGYPRTPEDAEYSFTMSFIPLTSPSGEELLYDSALRGTNNEKENARDIQVGKKYLAFVSEDAYNQNDFFKFTIEKDSTLYLSASTDADLGIGYGRFMLHNGSQDLSLEGLQPEFTSDKSLSGYKLTVMYAPWKNGQSSAKLPAGTYYLELYQGRENTGTYSFSLSTKAPKPVQKLSIKPKKIKMKVGDTKKLTATVKPSNASDKTVTYRSSDPLIASVDSSGNITALSTGIVTITVTTNAPNKKGKQLSAGCKVTIK